jgi:arginyl-tRNA synthetase
MVSKDLRELINKALEAAGVAGADFSLEHPTDLKMGDYSTNAAIKYKHKEEIFEYLNQHKPEFVERIELAGPGFTNFYLSKEFFKKSLGEIIEKGENFGRSEHAKGMKVIVEHTDPNPFKEFHIGHLMPNVIGSTVARIFEWNGAEVKQANYQGDKGIHVAKAVWGMINGHTGKDAYVTGNKAYEENPEAKKEIEEINKKIYDESDSEIMKVYEEGKKASLEYFEKIYKRLGTKFDFYFFESDTAKIGEKIVRDNIGKVFEESDGAIVFKGEKFDPSLHTRVFINSQGIPTYEAKDLGNAKNKADKWPHDLSVVVTGNEIKDYFRVMLAALKQIYPDLLDKTKHLPHGMLRLPTGKMSSRTGDVITAEELIEEVKTRTKGDEQVAIAAIKYMILRQAIGNDIIFDFEKSVSTEGDSGVYLQYAHARANSILEKDGTKGRTLSTDSQGPTLRETHEVEKLLYRFPEIVERAGKEYAPNYITTYLTELASSFNNFYAHEQVLDDSPESSYRLAIVEAFKNVMKNGLTILGIPAPERM